MNGMEPIPDELKSLVKDGTFALLVIVTTNGDVICRPIGGDYDPSITDAIDDMNAKYPGCKMRLFEHAYDTYYRYFKGVVPQERLLD